MALVAVVAILAGAGAGYLVGNANLRTVTSVSTTTTTVSGSSQAFGYLTIYQGCTLGATSHTPCIGSPAYVFNSCLTNQSMPATPTTCAYTVHGLGVGGYPIYSFNITLGVLGQSGEPDWADCWVSGGIGYSNCIPIINSTAFIVAVPGTPAE